MITSSPVVEEILYSYEDIVKRCEEIGTQISKDYEGKNPVLIGLLRGSVPFMAELMKHITVDIETDYLNVKSYEGTATTGVVNILSNINTDIKGRDIIFIEDIIDTGLTLATIMKRYRLDGANSMEIACLLNKKERRTASLVEPKYVGFDIPNKFVIGFGMDYNQKYRNLPFIGVLKESVYK